MARVRVMLAAVVTTVAAIVLGLVVAAPAAAVVRHRPGARVTVMTRNLYVGGDITRPIRAAAGRTGRDAVLALGHANHELRAVVDQTNFPVRSRLLAAEIARARPDVVGLQEVAVWRHGPLELDRLGVLDADLVDYDYLAILLSDLNRSGVRYRVAAAQTETDVEAPAFLGDPFAGTASQARDVRLTVQDVILVRGSAALHVEDQGGAQYRGRLTVDLGSGLNFTVVRGYAWIDLRTRSARLRLITTHLESQSSDLALAQARELLTGPARTTRPAVVVCDCNSDPLNDTVRPGDHVPHDAAYRLITRSGWLDTWLQPPQPSDPGWTAGLSELVNDPTADRLDHRIDMIFARGTARWQVTAGHRAITGATIAERDPTTGLWPSDHAGVSATLRLSRVRPPVQGHGAAVRSQAAAGVS